MQNRIKFNDSQLGKDFPSLKYGYEIQIADPKTFIPKYADEQVFDLIIIGSKDLHRLRIYW